MIKVGHQTKHYLQSTNALVDPAAELACIIRTSKVPGKWVLFVRPGTLTRHFALIYKGKQNLNLKKFNARFFLSPGLLSRLRISEASYRPADGPGASMGWSMRGVRVVNDRVASYVGSSTVSPCVRLLSCFAGWSGASDTREQIQNDIFIA